MPCFYLETKMYTKSQLKEYFFLVKKGWRAWTVFAGTVMLIPLEEYSKIEDGTTLYDVEAECNVVKGSSYIHVSSDVEVGTGNKTRHFMLYGVLFAPKSNKKEYRCIDEPFEVSKK